MDLQYLNCYPSAMSPAVLRVAGALQKSTEVMKAMQSLVKIPEIQATMRELSKEMMKVSSCIYRLLFMI